MAKKAKVVSFTVPDFDKVKVPQLIMPVLIVVAFVWLGILTFRVLSLEGQGGNNQAAVPSQQAAPASPKIERIENPQEEHPATTTPTSVLPPTTKDSLPLLS